MAAGDIIQSKTAILDDSDSNLTCTFDNDFTPGNDIILVVSPRNYQKGYSDSLINTPTDNKSHTYTKRCGGYRIPTSAYSDVGDLWVEIYDCLAATDASPSTHITVTIDPKWATGNANQIFLYMAEVEGLAAFKEVGSQTGGGVSSSSVTTTTPTLDAQPQFCITGFAAFATGVGSPTGWDSVASTSGVIQSAGVATKTATALEAVSATWTHNTTTYGSVAMAATYTLSGAAYRAKFELDPSVFTSADTSIEGYVWFTGNPDDGAGTYFSGLSGDATAGTLYITSGLPGGLVDAQAIIGVFHNGTDTSGLIAGVIEEV